MTPRELLEACDAIDDDCDCSGGAVAELTDYVRSTVRLDDDEPPTPEWCEQSGAVKEGSRLYAFDTIQIRFDTPRGIEWHHSGGRLKDNPTRRDVRRLAEIVGVKLKEDSHG